MHLGLQIVRNAPKAIWIKSQNLLLHTLQLILETGFLEGVNYISACPTTETRFLDISPDYFRIKRSHSIMNSNNSLATTAVGGALVAGKLATLTGATATGIATTTGGIGISTVATATGTAMSVAIAPAIAIAAPVVAVGAFIWWLSRD
ncbi:hypothetical protein CP500_006580 [Tychonema bourrellyi FEM_GT703]|uniref:Uncharacterized protein n=2 Tax=Tychonema bourrellyi TaxID=54313 RepID=A0A2G4F3B3_9CYAN|nr:hypothetical protein CP500_006580 [Tychonema bourrellyi FEM_GT703]